jgi:aspartate racemase
MGMVGVIGGIGPESTIEYYRLLVSSHLKRVGDGSYPQVLINSIDMKKMLDLIAAGRLDEVAGYLAAEVDRLSAAGADFALMASNTPHIVFDRVRRASSLPLVSIVEAACEETLDRGLGRVGLFGTRFTMEGGFYPEVFSARGIEVVVPGEADREYIHGKYMEELVKGVFREETRRGLLEIAGGMAKRERIEGLILGGTELPLILKEGDDGEVPFLDTTRIHVERALERLA